MNGEHWRFLRVQILVAAVFNFALNGGVAWLMFGSAPAMPMWARGPSVGSDTIGTSFFLPLVTCLILTRVVRRLVRSGRAPRLEWTRESTPLLRRLPNGTFARGAVLGLASAVALAPATVLALQLAGYAHMAGAEIVLFKGVYSALLAALVTVPIVVWALAVTPTSAGGR